MSKNIDKYYYKQMDKTAGIEHTYHRTKIVATIGPASRQREVLRLLAQGKRMKEIAAELEISVRTVENHKAQLLQVLSLGSTADLVRFAIKQHIVPE